VAAAALVAPLASGIREEAPRRRGIGLFCCIG
jgi:hypothetical protein